MLIQLSEHEVLWKDHITQRVFPCSIGLNGFIDSKDKREGDTKTPRGTFNLLKVYYRADRTDKPICTLPIQELRQNSYWCDQSDHPLYNQYFENDPTVLSYEKMWMEKSLYDILITTDHNTNPPIAKLGSAIFLHCNEEEPLPYKPTLGCLKLKKEDLLWICSKVTNETKWIINC